MKRGIACIGGDGPERESCAHYCASADLIAAADSGLHRAESAHIIPDCILGDMDSLDDLSHLDRYAPGKIIRYPADKDYTDTELALQWLWDQGCTETWLLGGGGGRLDHSLGIRLLFDRERHPDRWITAHEDVHIIESGTSFSDSPHPGTIISVFSCGSGPWRAESEGLHWSLNGIQWEPGFFGLSNRAEGTFRIRAVTGNFLVIIPLKVLS